MVKSPEVLILDEPCQGLDRPNRCRMLALVDRIAQQTDTQIIFVTHRPDEIPAGTTHFLNL
jgi:molybdate transport system ATP-binding protein